LIRAANASPTAKESRLSRRSAGEEKQTLDKNRIIDPALSTVRGIIIAIGAGLALWAVLGIGLWYLLAR
jgi:hypothetical protein